MAEFNVIGFDEVEKQLLRRSKIAAEAVPKMLKAGAAVIIQAQQSEIQTMELIRTGDFYRSIGTHKEEIKDYSSSTTIAPLGKDRKGVRNAEKGAIAEYGLKKGTVGKKRRKIRKNGGSNINNRNQAARRWMSVANEKSEEKVHKSMLEVWENMNNDD